MEWVSMFKRSPKTYMYWVEKKKIFRQLVLGENALCLGKHLLSLLVWKEQEGKIWKTKSEIEVQTPWLEFPKTWCP